MVSFPQVSSLKSCATSPFLHTCHMPRPSLGLYIPYLIHRFHTAMLGTLWSRNLLGCWHRVKPCRESDVSEEHPVSMLGVEMCNLRNWSTQDSGSTVMRRITTFRSATDPKYDGGPIILQYNVITLTAVLQLPAVLSTVTCCTGLQPSSSRLYRID